MGAVDSVQSRMGQKQGGHGEIDPVTALLKAIQINKPIVNTALTTH